MKTTVLSLLLAAAAPAAALAQQSSSDVLVNRLTGAPQSVMISSDVMLRFKSDGQDVKAARSDGQWTVTLNGKDLPADRYTITDDKLVVRDESGKEILSEQIDVEDARPTVRMYRPGARGQGGLFGGSNMADVLTRVERPTVRMGIAMQPTTDDLIQHLGLAKGEYAVVKAVTKGMPAEAAGVEVNDIIVSIEGKSPASPETIRETLKGRKPGDKIKLTIVRKGVQQDLDLTLAAVPANDPVVQGLDADQEKRLLELQERFGKLGNLREFSFALPRGEGGKDGDVMMFANPGNVDTLRAQLDRVESRLSQIEEMLRRIESRHSGMANPPAFASPPSGGGATGDRPMPYARMR